MKLQIINERREPESVAPKIKVFDSEADLDAALPDLKDGAIVATKEDESTEITESRDKTYFYKTTATSAWLPTNCYFVADKPQGYVHVQMIKNNTHMINVIWDVAKASLNINDPIAGDSITAGLNDNVYVGKASLRIGVPMVDGDTKAYFITTKDCILEHIETR